MKASDALRTLFAFLTFGAFANAEPLAVGAPAPEPTGQDQDGKSVAFKDIYAKGPTLVYFYPKADTPGCTKQACSLRDDWSALQGKGIQVLGVSEDQTGAQKSFAEKYKLPFTLIADHDGKVAQAFGVEMMGALTKRQSFLVKNGKIVWTMLKASTETHAKDVLAAYEGLAAK